MSDPPKIALTDSGDGAPFDQLLICKVDGSTPAQIKAAYVSSDGSAGSTTTQTFKDGAGATKTMTFKNGLLTGIA
jgi:hypothetical protein